MLSTAQNLRHTTGSKITLVSRIIHISTSKINDIILSWNLFPAVEIIFVFVHYVNAACWPVWNKNCTFKHNTQAFKFKKPWSNLAHFWSVLYSYCGNTKGGMRLQCVAVGVADNCEIFLGLSMQTIKLLDKAVLVGLSASVILTVPSSPLLLFSAFLLQSAALISLLPVY